MEKSNNWGTNLDLGVIQPWDSKFHIIDLVRPPVDYEPTPPTQNGQNGKIHYAVINLDLGVIQPEDLIFHFLDFVRPLVGCEITPLTQNGQNGNCNYGVANLE